MASLDLLLTRVADTHHFKADLSFHFNAIRVQHFTLIPIQIWILLIKVLRNGDPWFTDPTGLSKSLHTSIVRRPQLMHNGSLLRHLKLLNFDFKEDMDEDPDPDSASQNKADPCGFRSGSATLL
jgi:hypothetical protein